MQADDIFIVHPSTSEQANALKAFIKALKIKFELTNDKRLVKNGNKKLSRKQQVFIGDLKKAEQLLDEL